MYNFDEVITTWIGFKKKIIIKWMHTFCLGHHKLHDGEEDKAKQHKQQLSKGTGLFMNRKRCPAESKQQSQTQLGINKLPLSEVPTN